MALNPELAAKYQQMYNARRADATSQDEQFEIRYAWKGNRVYARTKEMKGNPRLMRQSSMNPLHVSSSGLVRSSSFFAGKEEPDGVIQDDVIESAAYFEEAQRPIFRGSKKSFLVWLALDVTISRLLLHFRVFSEAFAWAFMMGTVLYYFWKKRMDELTIERQYGGWTVNAIFGLHCGSGPAKYLQQFPSFFVFCSCLYKIAVILFLYAIDEHKSLYECSITECEGSTMAAMMTFLWDIFYLTEIFLLLSFRFNMTEAAKHALSVEAERVNRFSKVSEDLLTKVETRAILISDFRTMRRTKFMLAVTLVYIVTFVWTIQVVIETIEGSHFSQSWHYVLAIASGLLSAPVTALALLALMHASFGLWATFQAGYLRLRILSNFVDDEEIKSPQDAYAWIKVRTFVTIVVLPIIFQQTNLWLSFCLVFGAVLIIREVLTTLYLIAEGNRSSSDIFFDVWFGYCVVLTGFMTFYVALLRVEAIYLEQTRQITLVKHAILDQEFQQTTDDDERLKKAKQDPEKADQLLFDYDLTEMQYNPTIASMNSIMNHMKEHDTPPTIMGVQITPLLVKSVLGYFLSAVLVIIASFIKNNQSLEGASNKEFIG